MLDTDKKFVLILYWLQGTIDMLESDFDDPATIMTMAGYSNGATRALDYCELVKPVSILKTKFRGKVIFIKKFRQYGIINDCCLYTTKKNDIGTLIHSTNIGKPITAFPDLEYYEVLTKDVRDVLKMEHESRVKEEEQKNSIKEFVSKPSPFDGSGPWSSYKDNAIGRAINHIYHICGVRYAEDTVFHGNGIITLGQEKPFAEYHWDRGYPYFDFVDDMWNRIQDQKLSETM